MIEKNPDYTKAAMRYASAKMGGLLKGLGGDLKGLGDLKPKVK